jgi:hypothetical protein
MSPGVETGEGTPLNSDRTRRRIMMIILRTHNGTHKEMLNVTKRDDGDREHTEDGLKTKRMTAER